MPSGLVPPRLPREKDWRDEPQPIDPNLGTGGFQPQPTDPLNPPSSANGFVPQPLPKPPITMPQEILRQYPGKPLVQTDAGVQFADSMEQPRQRTQAEINARLAQPIQTQATSEQMFGPVTDQPRDANGDPLPSGQIQRTTDGFNYRWDAETGQNTPVMFDVNKRQWIPRDQFLEDLAKDDPDLAQEYRKLRAQARVIDSQLGDGIDDQQEAQAKQQIDARLWRLAKGAGPAREHKTPQDEFKAETVIDPSGVYAKDRNGEWKRLGDAPKAEPTVAPVQEAEQNRDKNGAVWGRDQHGVLKQLADPPKDEKEQRRKAQLDMLMKIQQSLTTKNPESGASILPDIKEVIAQYESVMSAIQEIDAKEQAAKPAVDSYGPFGNTGGYQAATQPQASKPPSPDLVSEAARFRAEHPGATKADWLAYVASKGTGQ